MDRLTATREPSMITELEIERARQAVAAATEAVAAAEGLAPSEAAGAEWGSARARQSQAQAALERLLAQRDRDQVAAAARAKVEKAAGKQLDTIAAELVAAA